MLCKNCGTTMEETDVFCPECGAKQQPEDCVDKELSPTLEEPAAEPTPTPEEPVAEKEPAPAKPVAKPRKKPHIIVRMLMQLISFALCIVLMVSIVGCVLVLDLQATTSTDGLKQLITSVLMPAPRSPIPHPMVGAAGIRLDASSGSDSSDNTQSALVDWLYQELENNYSEEISITPEAIEEFLQESTVSEYLTDKIVSYASDFITGENTTELPVEEIKDLIEENAELIEKTFNVAVDETLVEVVTGFVEEQNVDKVIKEETFEAIGNISLGGESDDSTNDAPSSDGSLPPSVPSIPSGSITVNDVLAMLRPFLTTQAAATAIGVCAGIILLLCLANWYNVPAGLTWSAIPTILIGLVLAAPVGVLQNMPNMIASFLGEYAFVADILASFAQLIAPVHYGVPAVGVALLVISIIWRIVRRSIRKKQAKALAAA